MHNNGFCFCLFLWNHFSYIFTCSTLTQCWWCSFKCCLHIDQVGYLLRCLRYYVVIACWWCVINVDWFSCVLLFSKRHFFWCVSFDICLQFDHVGPFWSVLRLFEILIDVWRCFTDLNGFSYIFQLSTRNGFGWCSFKHTLRIFHVVTFLSCCVFVLGF